MDRQRLTASLALALFFVLFMATPREYLPQFLILNFPYMLGAGVMIIFKVFVLEPIVQNKSMRIIQSLLMDAVIIVLISNLLLETLKHLVDTIRSTAEII